MAGDTTRIGFWFVLMAWIALFSLMAYLFSIYDHEQSNPNEEVQSLHSEESVQVVILPNRHNHYVFKGKINGHTVTFMVDTGATDVVIPKPLAKKIGLTMGYPMQAKTANGVISVYATRLDTLDIGDIHLENIKGSINPSELSQKVLLGMSALRHLDFMEKGGNLILIQDVRGQP